MQAHDACSRYVAEARGCPPLIYAGGRRRESEQTGRHTGACTLPDTHLHPSIRPSSQLLEAVAAATAAPLRAVRPRLRRGTVEQQLNNQRKPPYGEPLLASLPLPPPSASPRKHPNVLDRDRGAEQAGKKAVNTQPSREAGESWENGETRDDAARPARRRKRPTRIGRSAAAAAVANASWSHPPARHPGRPADLAEIAAFAAFASAWCAFLAGATSATSAAGGGRQAADSGRGNPRPRCPSLALAFGRRPRRRPAACARTAPRPNRPAPLPSRSSPSGLPMHARLFASHRGAARWIAEALAFRQKIGPQDARPGCNTPVRAGGWRHMEGPRNREVSGKQRDDGCFFC
ncbi:hypothetical protein BDY21DRAFT_39053 [Lineolata rhizophorae]|uniref:Uncharacterized protein n=1 Tax=Lineolata rhizophorae TaxID=578093 RepID=A0A6A6P1J1_9PEZI|nr:hypothetical protein BDY21DRAFT_39053 [Lineolata rhizophorae]